MPEIRMDYDQMEEMITTLHAAARRLEETMSEMQKIAAVMEQGALLGRAGDAFSHALRSELVPAIQRLGEKCEDRARFAQAEMEDHMEAQRRAGNLF